MWKVECTREKFKLDHHHPEDFTRSFWQKEQRVLPVWLLYRVVIVVALISAIFVVLSRPDEGYIWYKQLAYLTYWCYALEIAALTLALIICVQRLRLEKKDPELPPMDKMPKHYQALWCLYTICAPSSIVITTIFWLFIYDPAMHPTMFYTFVTHVFNSLGIGIDFTLNAFPFRFLHFYLPCLFCILYGLFSIIYQLSGGTGIKGQIPLYAIMDWRYPVVALSSCAISMACIILVHSALCLLNILKHWMKKSNETENPREGAA